MLRLSIATLFAAAALAQAPADAAKDAPPPEVDQALRARVEQFYDLQVKGQFRQTEQFVAEDTKDAYYNQGKPKFESAKLVRIEYSDNFTRAKAVVAVERYINAPPFPPNVLIKGNVFSDWKIENGQWFYYEDPKAPVRTPFGNMPPSGGLPGVPGSLPSGMPGVGAVPGMPSAAPGAGAQGPDFSGALQAIRDKVKVDRPAVTLQPGGSAKVFLTNAANGPMNVTVIGKPEGITAKPGSIQLSPDGKEALTIEAAKGARAGEILLRVEQSGETLSIRVELQ